MNNIQWSNYWMDWFLSADEFFVLLILFQGDTVNTLSEIKWKVPCDWLLPPVFRFIMPSCISCGEMRKTCCFSVCARWEQTPSFGQTPGPMPQCVMCCACTNQWGLPHLVLITAAWQLVLEVIIEGGIHLSLVLMFWLFFYVYSSFFFSFFFTVSQRLSLVIC